MMHHRYNSNKFCSIKAQALAACAMICVLMIGPLLKVSTALHSNVLHSAWTISSELSQNT